MKLREIVASNLLRKLTSLSPEGIDELIEDIADKNKNHFEFLNDIINWLVDNGHLTKKYKNLLLNEENSNDSHIKQIIKEESSIEDFDLSRSECDWCNAPATFSNEIYSLCENCADQMLGY
jgi:hypothetical protein